MEKPLSDLLKKYRSMRPPNDAVCEIVAQAINERFGSTLKSRDVRLNQYNVRVYATPALKQKIFIEQEALVQKINAKLGNKKTVRSIS